MFAKCEPNLEVKVVDIEVRHRTECVIDRLGS